MKTLLSKVRKFARLLRKLREFKEKIAGLKKILENVHEDGKKRAISPEIEQDGADFKGICSESARKKQNFKEKLEGSSKILSELENKLFQSEKEKVFFCIFREFY